MIRLKLIVLALCLVLSAALTAHAGSKTDAYFSDTKPGSLTGTLGSWGGPCSLVAGTSTARHWDFPGQAAKVMPIAYFDMDGVLCLDFGDVTPGTHDSSPDVFRIQLHATTAQEVTFVVTGSVSGMIDQVELANHTSLLTPGEASAVRVQLAIPRDVTPSEYTGWLVVATQGSEELRIPLMLAVRTGSEKPKPHPSASPGTGTPFEPSSTPSPSPSVVPDAIGTPTPDGTPTSTPAATPVATPLGTPFAEP